ncbi:MAG: hypothetical protein V3573_00710 [Desulfovibrionaceae bacterium]
MARPENNGLPGPEPGLIENFLLGLRVVWREVRRAAALLLRRIEHRALAKRLEEEYRRLGRIEADSQLHGTETDPDQDRSLILAQIRLLRREIIALQQDMAGTNPAPDTTATSGAKGE